MDVNFQFCQCEVKFNFVFVLNDVEVGWSPWRTCFQTDGNLCRCQERPCQDRQNSSCEGGLEFRLENCTGN